MVMAFRYKPLTEPDSIRLLLLQPRAASADDEIRCQLQHTTLSDCENDLSIAYIALSYVWGDEVNQRTIIVDGAKFHVTLNLYQALYSIRHASTGLLMWADAICINQQDDEERSKQVALMGSIYADARSTIIYLGESDADSSHAMQALNSPEAFLREGKDRKSTKDCIVSSILSRTWFTRVWVLQELALSQNPILQMGYVRMSWGKLPSFLSTWREGPVESAAKPLKTVRLLADMQEIREKIQISHISIRNDAGSERMSLLDLVQLRSGLGAKDPRDIIFAHVGMLNHTSRDRIDFYGMDDQELEATRVAVRGQTFAVDYNKSVVETFNRFAQSSIQQAQSLSILLHTEETYPLDRLSGLASWAPDWTLRSQQHIMDFMETRARSESLHGSPLSGFFTEPWISDDSSIMAVLASPFARIKNVSEVINFSDESLPRFLGTAGSCENFSFDKKILLYQELYELWQKRLGTDVLNNPGRQSLNDYKTKLGEWDPRQSQLMTLVLSHREIVDKDMFPSIGDYLIYSSINPQKQTVIHGRRVALLNNGINALVPASATKGDIVTKTTFDRFRRVIVLRGCGDNDATSDSRFDEHLQAEILEWGQREYKRLTGIIGQNIFQHPPTEICHYNVVGTCSYAKNRDSNLHRNRIAVLH